MAAEALPLLRGLKVLLMIFQVGQQWLQRHCPY